MRRVVVGAMGTLSGLVLLFSYHTSLGGTTLASGTTSGGTTTGAGSDGTTSTPTPTESSGSSSSSGSSAAAPSTSSSSSSSSGSTSAGSSGSSGTYTGQSVDTRWGPVQVRITVENGKITAAQAVVYPQENPRDQEINAYALPALHDEVLAAQSAQVDAISGATVTSDGYLASLQSALDAAHLGS